MRSTTARRVGSSLVLVVGLLASLILVVAQSPSVQAQPAQAAQTGTVRGQIVGAQPGPPKVKLLWFTKDWTYLGARKAYGGAYSISLPPGTYHLQFVDQRPAYDVAKYAPSDIKVTIKTGPPLTKNVRMRRGAAIVGTVKAGGKVAKGARVVAASPSEQSFEVTANKQGQFALAGLPEGKYSVFTYDHAREWVAKSLYVPRLQRGQILSVSIKLNQKAGGLSVTLKAGGNPIDTRIFVTAVSKQTGQFWTARSSHGSVTFRGLYPGRYNLVVPGVGNYLGRTGSVKHGNVVPNRVAFGSFRLNRRGASLIGKVVVSDGNHDPVNDATVRLKAKSGALIEATSTNSNGGFHLGGQLTSASGLTLVVFNRYSGDYEKLTLHGISIVTGVEKDLGTLELIRKQPAAPRP